MYYEVFIPSPDPDGFDVTITVDADNWMAALKSGLQRTGEGADAVRNVMCDIKDDNTIHVTDASTRRVFVLREVSEDEYDAGEAGEQVEEAEEDTSSVAATQRIDLNAEQASPPAQPEPSQPAQPPVQPKQPEPTPQPQARGPERPAQSRPAQPKPAEKPQAPAEPEPPTQPQARVEPDEDPHSFSSEAGRLRIGSSTHEALQRDEEEPRVLRETRSKTDQKRSIEIGRHDEKVSESLIEDIFLEIQVIHEGEKTMEEVINFVMDMAMDKVGAESGSVLFADVNGRELYFATARGPKADEIMDYRVPMGKGIVGFCTREGVSLAISDAPNDPRFYKSISESLGYETQGLLCAPIQYEGRVYGALELINKKSHTGFSANEMNALTYLGRQLAQYVNDTIMRNEKLEN